jgi:integrase
MATAFWKKDSRRGRKAVLAVRWRNARGEWVEERRPNDRTKAQALEYARERERQAELQRKGLAVAAEPIAFGVIKARWWLRAGQRRRSESKHAFKAFLDKHLAPLEDFVLTPGTAGTFADKLDQLLNGIEDAKALAPKSLNDLRSGVHTMFEHAKDPKVRLWTGDNPVAWVKRRTVPRSKKPTLAHHEVLPVLSALPEPFLGQPWRWVAATMIYAGERPGEAFGLHKADCDLEAGVMTIRHSWSAPLPKDDEPRTVVIVPELGPHLEAAMRCSPSDLVFPRTDGSAFDDSIRWGLVDRLRRALVKAGVVIGYDHACRRCKANVTRGQLPPSTVTTWRHADGAQRTCPSCGMKLWAKALPRPLRFYDLRHTHGTLLRRGGVDLGTVQKALGHSDPRLTAMTYDHTDLEDRRPHLARVLTFETQVAPVVRENGAQKHEGRSASDFSSDAAAFMKSGRQDLNLRPLGPEARGGAGSPTVTERTEPHGPDDSGTSLRRVPAHSALNAPIVTTDGGAGGARLPSAVPSFLEACANLAQQAAERGDFARAVELMQKAAQVAALREGAA